MSRSHDSPQRVLDVDRVSKRFGAVEALAPVTFELHAGEILGVVGRNGAGKTTLLDLISGVHRPSTGRIDLCGLDVVRSSPDEIARHGLGRSYQLPVPSDSLLVDEYLSLARRPSRFERLEQNFVHPLASASSERAAREASHRLLERYGLDHLATRACTSLSYGEFKLISVLRAVYACPRVLLLDEPTSSLAELHARAVEHALREFAAQGGALLLIAHSREFIARLADRKIQLGDQLSGPVGSATNRGIRAGDTATERHSAASSGSAAELEVGALDAWQGSRPVVEGVSLRIQANEVVGVIGANGAGKSTLLRAIVGLCDRVSGTVKLKGEDLVGLKPHEVARKGCVYVPQGARVPDRLTVRGALEMSCSLPDERGSDRATSEAWSGLRTPEELLALFPEIDRRRNLAVALLSGGERQVLALCMALSRRPDVLLLDEPSVGLDRGVLSRFLALLRELVNRGAAALVVEQDVGALCRVADHGITLASGRRVENWDVATNEQIVR